MKLTDAMRRLCMAVHTVAFMLIWRMVLTLILPLQVVLSGVRVILTL